MARVAVVTGGTRGIGRAISEALKNAGYKVAANYVGDDVKAQAFNSETGIAAYKFDVGDYPSCEAAVMRIEAEIGPIDILVNNAGITRDGLALRMK
ncbi:MAG TPA: SDR family NAD(P)-dependent oxidoreductase, partial [Alphaproteobacteria bacterium]